VTAFVPFFLRVYIKPEM